MTTRDPQRDGPGPGLPVALTVAVALRQPVGTALAMRGASHLAYLKLHQPLRGKPEHLAEAFPVEMLQDCQDLVGLLRNFDLAEHKALTCGEGKYDMGGSLCARVVAGSADGLAIDRNHHLG